MRETELLDRLSSLSDKSLITTDLTQAEARYSLLETTRQYALRKLQQEEATTCSLRFVGFYAALFAEATRTWSITATGLWLGRSEPEIPNLRQALEWAFAEANKALAVELASNTVRIWEELSLYAERDRWIALALAAKDSTTPLAAVGRLHLGRSAISSHGDRSAIAHLTSAVECFRTAQEPLALGEALARAGATLLTPDTVAEARPYLTEAYQLLSALGPTKQLAGCLRSQSALLFFDGKLNEARPLLAASQAMWASIGDEHGVLAAKINLAEIDFAEGSFADAISLAAAVVSDPKSTPRQVALAKSNLAAYLIFAERGEEAQRLIVKAAEDARALGWSAQVCVSLEFAALAFFAAGHAEEVARLLGYTDRATGNARRQPTEHRVHERLSASLSAVFNRERFVELASEGAGWDQEQALASVHTLLARAAVKPHQQAAETRQG